MMHSEKSHSPGLWPGLLMFVLIAVLSIGLRYGFSGGANLGEGQSDPEATGASTPGEWNSVRSPVRHTLLDIDMIDAGHGWAVGEEGTILRFDDGEWVAVNSPTTSILTTVHMIGPDDGWAASSIPAELLHYDGEAWSMVEDPVSALGPQAGGYYALEQFGNGQLVAAGGILGRFPHSVLLKKPEGDSEWSTMIGHARRNPFVMLAVSLREDGSGWGVGNQMVLPFASGGTVAREPLPETITATLTGVVTLSQDEAWAVGTGGSLAHYHNGNWQLLETAWPDVDLYDISMPNDRLAWAVGSQGTILRFEAGDWSLFARQHPLLNLIRPITFTALDMVTEDLGWAVGTGGTIWHYQR